MKKLFLLLFLSILLLSFSFINVPKSSSDEFENITSQINDLTGALNQSINATKPLESQLDGLRDQINQIKTRISVIENDLLVKKKNIDNGYKELAKQQEILNITIREYYIKSYYSSPILVFLSSSSASDITQLLAYHRATTNRDKAIITNIALSVTNLETKKKNLEAEEIKLSAAKVGLDEQSAKLDGIVSGAKDYQSKLSGQIAELSAKQQDLLAKKLGSLNIPRSAGTSTRGCSDDRSVDPGFSPRIAFFTYGAPHRNGLNQYGAWGRARAGQSEEQILQEYYPSMNLKKDYDQNSQISVDGYGTFSIEDYVKRIWEVPNSWGDQGGMNALKAQAVAARTYALNSMQRNGHICTTEACQVFRPDPKSGNWEAAVEATKGWVMMDGGNPGFTQYASTHGGYIQNLGKFDGPGGNPSSFSELNERAYDKESPWFYCDWGARNSYQNTAWLKPNEVADIVNVILLARIDSSSKDHLYQTDKPHPYGGEIWSEERVKSELRSKSKTPFNNVSNIEVSADLGSGKTNSITLSGDGGSQSFSGSEFKDWFNLRAPANIQIVGPLFNIEKK
ncbi:MAG TPA: SpoIID/LytB domain-containing protein [Patescibacteria group bacterium]|nr:SpoIID/LytB domain-containing protein [Patescibacteria group bacterium]